MELDVGLGRLVGKGNRGRELCILGVNRGRVGRWKLCISFVDGRTSYLLCSNEFTALISGKIASCV
jgi:hypothetical protein